MGCSILSSPSLPWDTCLFQQHQTYVRFLDFSYNWETRLPVRKFSNRYSTSTSLPLVDFSTLFIAIHGALQIFRPAIGEFDTGDGLYPYRNYVFAATLIVPVVVSSLAFANPDFPYTAQGAFCGLPPSPPWWRLGLAWIPRYIIGLTVTGLAISVYAYVEWKFHAFSKASRRASTITITVDHPAGPSLLALDSNTSPESVQEDKERRPSVTSLRLPKQTLQDPPVTGPPEIQSLKEVRSLLDNRPEPEIKELLPQGRKQSVCTVSSTFSRTSEKSSASVKQRTSNLQSGSAEFSHSRSLPAIPATPADFTLPSSDSPLNSHESPNSVHRRQLRQQLRLIFIYPIVYIVLWIPPMVLNVFQFFPKYQLKLPSWLAIFATICFMLMGFVDCIVFLWREKPWRRGANPTSVLPKAVKRSSCFRWRKRDDDNNVEAARSTSFPSVLDTKGVDTAAGPGSIPRGSQDTLNPLSPRFLLSRPKFGTRSSSEARSKARELAYQRLALERGAQALEPRESIGSQPSAAGDAGDTGRNTSVGSSTGMKEWWDRKDSLFRKDSIYPSPVLEKEMEKS